MNTFKQINEGKVLITTADGKEYPLTRLNDIPLSRYVETKPYILQDEMQLTFESLNRWIDRLTAVIKDEKKSKIDMQAEVINLIKLLKERENFANDVITIRLYLAACVWVFDNENLDKIDAVVLSKKLALMQSSEQALNFFLSSEVGEFGILKTTVNLDTLTALYQFLKVQEALTNLPEAMLTA